MAQTGKPDIKQKVREIWEADPEFPRQETADKFGIGVRQIYRWIKSFKEDVNPSAPNVNTKEGPEEDFLEVVKREKDIRILDLSNILGMIPRDIEDAVRYYSSKGMEIGIIDDRVVCSKEPLSQKITKAPLGDRELTFGIATDLHFGSKACQVTALNEFVNDCKKEGVTDILSPGDITSGINVYRGQREDLYAFSAEDQEDSCIQNLPSGVRWWMIGGNHDYDFMKTNGHNAVKSMAHKREDINYIGFDQANIFLLENVECILWHPSGGVPYAVSYRLQKGVEQQAYGELMHLIMGLKEKTSLRFFIAGHLHIQMQAMFGPIFGCQSGTFEGTTNYLRRKGFVPNIGGYIVKCCLDKDGRLKEHEAKFKHYREIEDDYKNYKHSPPETKKISEPIFS